MTADGRSDTALTLANDLTECTPWRAYGFRSLMHPHVWEVEHHHFTRQVARNREAWLAAREQVAAWPCWRARIGKSRPLGQPGGLSPPQGNYRANRLCPRVAERLNSLLNPWKTGAGEGIRTLDPNLGKVVLYP